MLLDLSDLNEAARQLNDVRRTAPDRASIYHLLAQVLLRQKAYEQAIAASRTSVKLDPDHPEAHFWLAESLRRSGELFVSNPSLGRPRWEEARLAYVRYLKLSDFESTLAGKLHYNVLGYLFGMGKKQRPEQADIWRDFRSIAYAGLGDCERLLGRYDVAIPLFQRSLHYDRDDALVHYALGLTYAQKADVAQSLEMLPPAEQHFRRVIEVNPHLDEAKEAGQYIARIRAVLAGSGASEPRKPRQLMPAQGV
jgi:tetratricopeptide (TPR) repeat protein